MNELQTWIVAVSAAGAANRWALKTIKGMNAPAIEVPRLNGELAHLRDHVDEINAILERMDRTYATREDINAVAKENRHATAGHLQAILSIVENIERMVEMNEPRRKPRLPT